MDYGPIFNNEKCTIDVAGDYIPIIDWLNGVGTPGNRSIVRPTIERQGKNPVCWAFAPGKLSETAYLNAGFRYRRAAIQDLLDHGYLPREGMTGHAPTTLEYLKRQGVCFESDYTEYTGKPPGITDPIPPHPLDLERRRIHDWYPVNGEEENMLAALQTDVLVVSVPMYDSFLRLNGKELLDLSAAEVKHIIDGKKRKRNEEDDEKEDTLLLHSVLLIGAGVFVPSDPDLQHLRVNYWVIKNQWGSIFADEGIGYLIRSSTLSAIHSRFRPKTRGFKQLLETNYFPYFAYVRGQADRLDPVYNSPVILDGFTEHQLVEWVTGKPFRKDVLIYFFYDRNQCALIPGGFNAVELITALGKTYAHDSSRVRLVLVDVLLHPNVVASLLPYLDFRFSLGAQSRVLLAYLPREFYRTISHSKRYPGEYNLGEILLWIGDKLSAGVRPNS